MGEVERLTLPQPQLSALSTLRALLAAGEGRHVFFLVFVAVENVVNIDTVEGVRGCVSVVKGFEVECFGYVSKLIWEIR